MKQFLDAKWFSLVLLNLLVILFVYTKQQIPPIKDNNLNAIDQRLNSIQTQLAQPSEQPDLAPINQNIKQLSDFIQQLQSKDDHQLGDLFSTEQVAIKKQLDGITDLLRQMADRKQAIKMLPVSQLPFTVLSIDSIQEIPVASVIYHYKIQALEKDDSLAGWAVSRIDFAKQTIEFENRNKERVLVRLQQQVNHA